MASTETDAVETDRQHPFPRSTRLVAFGIAADGMRSLATLCNAFPADFPAPALLVPHRGSTSRAASLESVPRVGGDGAIGVSLSGYGRDGVKDMQVIKARGGTTIVPDPGDTRFRKLPSTAIAEDGIDLVVPLPPHRARGQLRRSCDRRSAIPGAVASTGVIGRRAAIEPRPKVR